MKRTRSQPAHAHHEDQSELIGLSEINFLLVVALLALVAVPTYSTTSSGNAPDGQPGEVVRLETPTHREGQDEPPSEASSGGVPEATHELRGNMSPESRPVVIAVPKGFPLENVQFLIQETP